MWTLLALIIMTLFGGDTYASEYDFHAKFKNGKSIIALRRTSLEIDGKSYVLNDCSDNAYYCYEQEDLGFFMKFPKKCESLWSFGGENSDMNLIAVYPHTDMDFYASKYSSRFVFLYSDSGGLQAIYYDHGNDIISKDRSKILDDYQLDEFKYKKMSSDNLFQCR